MKTYEKITLKIKNSRSTKLYQIISETPILVFAREVDKEGEDKDYYNKNDTLIQTVHMMDKGIIQKRVKMVIDKKYGELREREYQDLQAGDTVLCTENFIINEGQRAFERGKKYIIKTTGIFDDGIKWITMVNDQGEDHTMDNEEYPNDDPLYFDACFKCNE
jgi:hypothetical protein